MSREVLFTKADIDKRVRELADIISRDYLGKDLVIIGILKGAFIFTADLVRLLQIPCSIDFARAASYGSETASSQQIAITKDIEIDISKRDVLIVEDIVDTGLTLSYLMKRFSERNPRSLKVCAFLDKKARRKVPIEADYVGFLIEDRFVVGYGLDHNEKFRFLPDVCAIEE
jgi:hypoxanthine phosphoribosyltransferase